MFLVGVEFFSRELRDEILRKAYISSRTEFQNIDILHPSQSQTPNLAIQIIKLGEVNVLPQSISKPASGKPTKSPPL